MGAISNDIVITVFFSYCEGTVHLCLLCLGFVFLVWVVVIARLYGYELLAACMRICLFACENTDICPIVLIYRPFLPKKYP